MGLKSDTCFGKKTGRPLTEYDSEAEALEGAAYAKERYGQNLMPYRCDRCGLWHLAPKSRHTPSEPCAYCTGADGKPKEAYKTQRSAQRRADIIRKEQGVELKVYPCEYGSGWHLTKEPS